MSALRLAPQAGEVEPCTAPGKNDMETMGVPVEKSRFSGAVDAPVASCIFGRNVSGRSWKAKQISRSSSLNQGLPTKTWVAKEALREQRKIVKEKEAELIEERKARLMEAKKHRDAKKSRKQRNDYENSQYQVISNSRTVKGMSKKQLRQVKRTRVSKEGDIELVDAYAPTRETKRQRR